MILLFGPPLAAVIVVGRRGHTGLDAARPFATFGAAAFVLAGILLVATLLGGELAVNFLLLGTAAFGGAISCGVTALVLWYREQRRAARARHERPWPHGEDG